MSKQDIFIFKTEKQTVGYWRVEGVSKESELEEDPLLQLDGDGVGLLHEDRVPPQIVAKRCKL